MAVNRKEARSIIEDFFFKSPLISGHGKLSECKCECDGCAMSRDPNQGYQPCHNLFDSAGDPPGYVVRKPSLRINGRADPDLYRYFCEMRQSKEVIETDDGRGWVVERVGLIGGLATDFTLLEVI